MESVYQDYRNSRIHYLCSGRGAEPLVCFHGFAETAASFRLLEKICGDIYSIYSFDMPFHGKTEWNEGLNFTIDDLENIIKSCDGLAGRKFSLMGYSMGGRVALSLYQHRPEKINGLILIASDGLTVNPWYRIATQTAPGNRIFRTTMHNPGWFLHLMNTGDRLGLVNSSVSKFVRRQIGNPSMRKQIYETWTTMRHLRPDISQIKKLINNHRTPVCLIFGKYDKIIRTSLGRSFIKNIEAYAILSEIESGHQLLTEGHAQTLKDILSYYFNHSEKKI
ncbi:alpha/beta hydrolase [Pollutibacter soli]|uniref:alpha/beta fold hydrolase n=1 Tax=Pollutibacter soli TaxID=3034157 RepID=UPI003013A4EB